MRTRSLVPLFTALAVVSTFAIGANAGVRPPLSPRLAPTVTTSPAVAGTSVSFTVHNPAELGAVRVIRGRLFRASCSATTVVLLQHGLSYTGDAWNVDGYSVAGQLVRAGYDVVAIDKLGYRHSPLANGRNVNVLADASIAHQVITQLRAQYAHVALGGHSAGGEESELEAALYHDVDALAVLGYSHAPSAKIVSDVVTGDDPRSILSRSGYEYFLGTPAHRQYMFFSADADAHVVAADARAAQLTPGGEMLSISPQPSRQLTALITGPVFVQLASLDRLFPGKYLAEEALLFPAAHVTTDLVPGDGHVFMLHHNGVPAASRMTQWLQRQPGTPSC